MAPVTLTEYAKRRGVSTRAVSKAIQTGRLVASVARDERGTPSIADPALADQEWATNTRVSAPPRAEPAAPIASARAVLAPAAVPDFNLARAVRAAASARRETAQAELAELELAERRGQLVDAEQARGDVIAAFALVKTRLLAVPSRAAQRLPDLAAQVEPVVDELIREALEELSHGGDRVGAGGE